MKQQFPTGYFTTKEKSFQLVLPINTEILIPNDSSVRLLKATLDKLDLSGEGTEYCKRERKIPFIILLRIVIYGFMRGIRSLRDIETACRENINFMWLLEGYRVPDHNMIGRFINEINLDSIFTKFNLWLEKENEIKFDYVFIDGTKFEANANRYTFVWKKSVVKNKDKLLPKIELFLADIANCHGIKFTDIFGCLNYFECLDFARNYGKGKRKSQEQRDLEAVKEYAEKLKKYDECIAKIGENRSSMSKTDPDATFMRLKDDHMRNGQLKPAYNVQLCIESEYITGVHISADRSDVNTLIPLLDKMQSYYGKKPKNATLDAGYESEENYAYLEKNKIGTYIKPANYEQSKTKKYKAQIGRKEKMSYNEKEDFYVCAGGKKLLPVCKSKRESASGYKQIVTVYRSESCADCPVRKLCTKAQEGKDKEISCSRVFEDYRAKSLANITSELGIKLRINRSIQSEGAFGVVKQDYEFRRPNRRGKKGVEKEILLISIGFNFNKLHSKILSHRLGFYLHEPKKDKQKAA